jgi:uncharacterized protein
MARLFLVVAVAVVVYLLLKSFRRNTPESSRATVTEDMVRCLQCGVHLPKSESLQENEQIFCCAAHRDAFRK